MSLIVRVDFSCFAISTDPSRTKEPQRPKVAYGWQVAKGPGEFAAQHYCSYVLFLLSDSLLLVAQSRGISQGRQAHSKGQELRQGAHVHSCAYALVALYFSQAGLPNITIHVASSPTGASVHIPVMGGRQQRGVCFRMFDRLIS